MHVHVNRPDWVFFMGAGLGILCFGIIQGIQGCASVADEPHAPSDLAGRAVGSDLIMPDLVSHNTVRYGLIGLTFSLVSWLFSAAVLVVAAAVLGALLDVRIVRSG